MVSLASLARMTCLMSSLTGVLGRNPIPLLCDRVGKSPRVGFHYSLTCLPIYSSSMGILWARQEAGLNLDG